MKGEGKNTTTLLSIKGFLWEDIKSILIFLSAPASGSIPAGSTHSSPIRSANMNFCVLFQQKTKSGESVCSPYVCTAGWETLVLKWMLVCLCRLHVANSHAHTFEFLRKIVPMALFCGANCPHICKAFVSVCLPIVCLVAFMLTVPFIRVWWVSIYCWESHPVDPFSIVRT